jgi:hypothetical protein
MLNKENLDLIEQMILSRDIDNAKNSSNNVT